MSSPQSKRQNKREPATLSSLPDDLLLYCFAFVSRIYYPTLSLVSKRFRSLVASPHLYQNRTRIDRTESGLYVGLVYLSDPNPRWFTLCKKPDRAITNDIAKKKNKMASGLFLASVSIYPRSPSMHSLGVVAVGSHIYSIGGHSEKGPSSRVSILDCGTNTWREAPSMKVKRYYPACNFLDGKIYVTGGCRKGNTLNWMEVFDIETQIWEFVVSPFKDRCENRVFKSAVMDGELCMYGFKGVSYIPKERRWDKVGRMINLTSGWIRASYCVINDVMYSYGIINGIQWYDIKEGRGWRKLRGLNGLPSFAEYGCVKLAECGGKMVVFWDKYLRSSGYSNKMIWCAVIRLERINTMEMWGEVESLDDILTVPKGYEFVCALSVTV